MIEAGRGEISTGNWSAEGETLTPSFEGYEEASIPFTFFEGVWFCQTFRISAKSGNASNTSGTRI